jgi:hypothetical protein
MTLAAVLLILGLVVILATAVVERPRRDARRRNPRSQAHR